MERGEQQLVVGNHTYDTVIFGPSKSFRTLTWIGNLVGGPIGILMAGSQASEANPDDLVMDESAVAKGVAILFANLHKKNEIGQDGWDLVCEILSATYVHGSKGRVLLTRPLIESHFHGKMAGVIKLVVFVLKENYLDFLREALAQAKEAGVTNPLEALSSALPSNESPSEAPSTGVSGGS